MQGAVANNNIANQNSYIDFANNQQKSWFDNVLTGSLQSAISTPFSFFNNANSVVANSPQTAVGMFSGMMGGGNPASNTSSPFNVGASSFLF